MADVKIKLIRDLGQQRATENSNRTRRFGLYLCPTCNGEFETDTTSVLSGKVKNCYSCRNIKHGDSGTKIYRMWVGIKHRCNSKKSDSYYRYGGRGIKVCSEWSDNYLTFKSWALDNGFSDELTIDRIDNDKGYYPENCRFTDYFTQSANKSLSSNNTSGYIGVGRWGRCSSWKAQVMSKGKVVFNELFKDKKDAVIARDEFILANKLPHKLNLGLLNYGR